MNISTFFSKSLIRCLVVVMLLFSSLFITQTTRASSPCTVNNLHAGIVAADETWCSGGDNIHYLTGDLIVQAGATLTIEAGVTVDSTEDAWSKYLIIQGHLDINGTAAQPVLLTRSYNYPNQNWAGLFFNGSQGDGSGTITYATITHAGSNFLPTGCEGTCGNGQTALFVKSLAPGKQVTINNSTITDNTSKGLFVVDSTVNVTNTSFSQNKYPISIEGAASIVTYSGNSFSNNAYPYYDNQNYTVQENSIFIGPDALMGQNFSLLPQSGLDAYVFLNGTTVPLGTTMTVDPGVTLRFVSDKYLNVFGHLEAVGTPVLPIRFSGIPSASDPTVSLNWSGLYFDGFQGDGSGMINYAIIDDAGSNFLPPGCVGTCGTAQTAFFVKDLPVTKQLKISYSIIRDSLKKGLFIINSPTALVDNNLIQGGQIGAYFASNMTVSNLALIDQTIDGVVIETGYSLTANHFTIARAGQSGIHVYTGGTGTIQNSILSHNLLAVKADGIGTVFMDTNLSDANTNFTSGTVTGVHTINGAAVFEADGYHIQTTSDAVGNGIAGLSGNDIDGNTRPWPIGTLPDLGADEISVGRYLLFLPDVIR